MIAHVVLLLVLGLGAAWLAGVSSGIPGVQARPPERPRESDTLAQRGDEPRQLPREILDAVAEVEDRGRSRLLTGI